MVFARLGRFCQRAIAHFSFWVICGFVNVAEPYFCSYKSEGVYFWIQLGLMTAGTIFFFVQLIGSATAEWDTIQFLQSEADRTSTKPKQTMRKGTSIAAVAQNLTGYKLLLFFSYEGDYILEFVCLAIGWIWFFSHPGIAAFRCFRVFRLLWFYKVRTFTENFKRVMSPFVGDAVVYRTFKVMRFAVKSLTALANEMLRVNDKTRGGFILILILTYFTFMVGLTIYQTLKREDIALLVLPANVTSTEAESYSLNSTLAYYEYYPYQDIYSEAMSNCRDLVKCTFTVLRLALFDSTGFDLLHSLYENHPGLYVLLFAYLTMTSFAIINGLVGVFSSIFYEESENVFDTYEEDEEEELRQNQRDDNLSDGDNDSAASSIPERSISWHRRVGKKVDGGDEDRGIELSIGRSTRGAGYRRDSNAKGPSISPDLKTPNSSDKGRNSNRSQDLSLKPMASSLGRQQDYMASGESRDGPGPSLRQMKTKENAPPEPQGTFKRLTSNMSSANNSFMQSFHTSFVNGATPQKGPKSAAMYKMHLKKQSSIQQMEKEEKVEMYAMDMALNTLSNVTKQYNDLEATFKKQERLIEYISAHMEAIVKAIVDHADTEHPNTKPPRTADIINAAASIQSQFLQDFDNDGTSVDAKDFSSINNMHEVVEEAVSINSKKKITKMTPSATSEQSTKQPQQLQQQKQVPTSKVQTGESIDTAAPVPMTMQDTVEEAVAQNRESIKKANAATIPTSISATTPAISSKSRMQETVEEAVTHKKESMKDESASESVPIAVEDHDHHHLVDSVEGAEKQYKRPTGDTRKGDSPPDDIDSLLDEEESAARIVSPNTGRGYHTMNNRNTIRSAGGNVVRASSRKLTIEDLN